MIGIFRRAWAGFDDPLSFFDRARTKLYSLWLSTTYPFASIGSNFSIHYTCVLKRPYTNRIRIGSSVILGKDAWLHIVSDEVNDVKIIIDDNCVIAPRGQISAKNLIHIERDVILGSSVLIQDHHHAFAGISLPIRAQGVTAGGRIRIEQGCWIGQGAVILCNEGELIIGRNSVVGANAVVGRSIPPFSVIVGNPGRLVKQFGPQGAAVTEACTVVST